MRRFGIMGLVCSLAAALMIAGAALAYLTNAGTGSGAGNATAATASVAIVASTGTTQALLPTGAATGDVKATLTNPNPSPVHISSLRLDSSQGSNGFSANASACALSFVAQTNGGGGWTIPASGQTTIDLTSSLTMGTSAASSCQGQTFTVYLATP